MTTLRVPLVSWLIGAPIYCPAQRRFLKRMNFFGRIETVIFVRLDVLACYFATVEHDLVQGRRDEELTIHACVALDAAHGSLDECPCRYKIIETRNCALTYYFLLGCL